jgi:hypothetical protein
MNIAELLEAAMEWMVMIEERDGMDGDARERLRTNKCRGRRVAFISCCRLEPA